ncbi:hypothetical protein ACFSL6_17500 [Paenibacillus thailandensis]|uniref:DUF5082 domain-containing protein n=1 Tax=Paenibacillus thailandensis TaxID=393250 RepID=A0ABW5R297_9BACL
MDRKTLEYMEGRAAKAREIVKKIDELSRAAEQIVGANYVQFEDHYGNIRATLRGYRNGNSMQQPRVVNSICKSVVEVIRLEIQQLEQELAEL